jgi:serine/threonine protein kinase
MVLNDRYERLAAVQHDGMGLVYQARDRNRLLAGAAEPWVALKFSRPARDSATTTVNHLRQEFLKLSQLNHPHIVTVYDLVIDRGTEFMVLEWLSGANLADTIKHTNGERIAQKKAVDIVRDVADALAFSHAAGIVHGDIKPSNIFLASNQTVKLLDFGASGQSPSRAPGHNEASWATPAYASCELAEGQSPQPGDDVFALGVTAYYLLSGERPFGNLGAVSARNQGFVPKPLPDFAFDYWPAIERALRFSADERFRNAQEFLDQFNDQADEPLQQADEPLVEVFHPSIPLQTRTLTYGALALLVLIAIVAWSISYSGDTQRKFEPLLDSAAAAMAAGRLVGPGEDHAFAYYSAILVDNPQNADALNGLDSIAEQYIAQSRAALAAENIESAVAALNTARDVQANHIGIPQTAELIGRYRQDLLLNAQLLSKTNVEQAEVLLTQAALLSDENDGVIARIRDALRQERSAAAVELLLRGIDQRILSERLTVPRGDSAVDLLNRASRLAPGHREVLVAAERIATALLFQAMFAISNGDLDVAQSFIGSAKSLKVKHLALARAEFELARARNSNMSKPDQEYVSDVE